MSFSIQELIEDVLGIHEAKAEICYVVLVNRSNRSLLVVTRNNTAAKRLRYKHPRSISSEGQLMNGTER